jgi:hypothetical protein
LCFFLSISNVKIENSDSMVWSLVLKV